MNGLQILKRRWYSNSQNNQLLDLEYTEVDNGFTDFIFSSLFIDAISSTEFSKSEKWKWIEYISKNNHLFK